MIDLLVRFAKGWCIDYRAVELISIALNLAPTLATTLRAAELVGVKIRHITEVLSQLLANDGHLMNALLSKGIQNLVVEGAVCFC